jgi:hypothetical protein
MRSGSKAASSISITDFFAGWGAILSTAAIVWSIIEGKRNRAKLEVVGFFIKNSDPQVFAISITNVGRRPVLPNGLFIALKTDRLGLRKAIFKPKIWFSPKGRRFQAIRHPVCFQKAPKMLKESECHLEYVHETWFLSDYLLTIFVVDSCNRTYEIPRKQIKEILRYAKEVGIIRKKRADKK